MRNASDELCRENENTLVTLNNSEPKIVKFMRYFGKI